MKDIKFLVMLPMCLGGTELARLRISALAERGLDGFVLSTDANESIENINEIIMYARVVGTAVWLSVSEIDFDADFEIFADSEWLVDNNGVVEKHTRAKSPSPFSEAYTYELISHRYEYVKSGLSRDAFEYLSGFVGVIDALIKPDNDGFVPWYSGIESDYRDMYNADMVPFLGSLFAESDRALKFRGRYRGLLLRRLRKSFIKPISEWCIQNQKAYFTMFDAGSDPIDVVDTCGSLIQMNNAYTIPSAVVSVGGESTENPPFSALTAGSAAHRLDGDAAAALMFETCEDAVPSALSKCVTRLIECGISIFVLCGAFKNTTLDSRYRPYCLPPSWGDLMPGLLDNFRKTVELESERQRGVLAVCPTRGIWESYIPSSRTVSAELSEGFVETCVKLAAMDRRFDITDEYIFENDAEFGEGGVMLGCASYGTLLTLPGCVFTKKGMPALEKAKANGVRVITELPKSELELSRIDMREKEEEVPLEVEQDNWTITLPDENCFPLVTVARGGVAVCGFTAEENIGDAALLVTERPETVSINGILAVCTGSDERGYLYKISGNIVSGTNSVTISGCGAAYAYLLGGFRVEKSVETGEYVLKNGGETQTDLGGCGFAFCRKYASAKKIISVNSAVNKPVLRLDCAESSAVEVFFDNTPLGVMYADDNTLPLPRINADERHVVEIKSYPPLNDFYARLEDAAKPSPWRLPLCVEIIQRF